MVFLKAVAIVLASFFIYMVDSRGIAGNIKLVAMNGNQYWFSSSSPYAPNLNYHLAYQYCRTLGLQLVVLETQEEVNTISAYLNSFEVGSVMNRNNYWTSGNRVGANSWLWMSSGEQLNGSFSEFPLLKQATDGPISTNSKNCLSMKSTVAKRAIFTPDECEKSLPFICEQVRCLYYNYPVTQFPDPNDLRSDIEETAGAAGVTQSESESRANPNFIHNEKLRSQNYISPLPSSSRNANTLRLAQIASRETRVTDPSKIQRRITLRPSTPNQYTASDYVNSFYKYQTVDYSATSTDRPSFKKATRETLWSPWPSLTHTLFNDQQNYSTTPIPSSDGSVTATIEKRIDNSKPVTFITSSSLIPAASQRSTVATSFKTTVKSSSSSSSSPGTDTTIHPLQNISSRRRANLEIVKIKATERNGGVTTISPIDEETTTLGGGGGRTTLEVIYSRRGPIYRKKEIDSTEATTLDPNKIVFDDEENNVGGEVDDITEDVLLRDATTQTAAVEDGQSTMPMFFQGNGIRRPDTHAFLQQIGIPAKTSTSTTSAKKRISKEEEYIQRDTQEDSQRPPSTLKQMFMLQRNKASRKPISWADLRSRKIESTRNSGSRSVSVTASKGPTKIALGPRLKFRTKGTSS